MVAGLVGQGLSILDTLRKSAAVTASEKGAVMPANGTVERVASYGRRSGLVQKSPGRRESPGRRDLRLPSRSLSGKAAETKE